LKQGCCFAERQATCADLYSSQHIILPVLLHLRAFCDLARLGHFMYLNTQGVMSALHVQVKALVATLPVRLKILDVAGSAAGIYTFEPTPIGSSSPTGASAQQASAGQSPASARTQPDTDVQKLWLIYRPGHYEMVYPAEGSEDLEKL